MKYRKKPVVIEAFRFKIDKAMPDWFNEKRITNEIVTHDDGTVEIKTLEGMMKANKGDYIIQGVNGEIYPCKPDIFEKTYDEVVSEMTPREALEDNYLGEFMCECGSPITKDYKYCPNCGQKLNWNKKEPCSSCKYNKICRVKK